MRFALTPEHEGVPRDRLRLLFFEDCSEDIELSLRTLRSAGFDLTCDIAVTSAEFLQRARSTPYDLILSDYRMPGATGMDIFELMKGEGISTPFILVTGSLGEEMAVDCLNQGVEDYVLKDNLSRLPSAVRRALEREERRRQRIRMEEALRASERSYRSLTQSAPCGILRLSAADGKLLDANAALVGMLGYGSAGQLLETGGIALPRDLLSHLIELSHATPHPLKVDVRWRALDGDEVLVRLIGRVLRDESGAPVCLEMIAENITERHLAERRIDQLNRLYSVLIHVGQAIVRIRDATQLSHEICRILVEDGGFQMAWLGILDADRHTLIPKASFPAQQLDETGRRRFDDALSGSPAGRAAREGRHIVCNDLNSDPGTGSWKLWAKSHHVHSMASFPVLMHGRPVGALTIFAGEEGLFDVENVALLGELGADLSHAMETLEIEKSHRELAAQLNQFFALSVDMLCIIDLEGRFQRLNPAWEKTLGYGIGEMLSRRWIDFVHPEDRRKAAALMQGLRADVDLHHEELRFVSKDGSHRWLVGSAAPSVEHGVVFAAVTDMTERKVLEQQLLCQNLKLEERNRRIEEASRLKSEFLANMSHELRSPLNGIIGFSELLVDGKLGALPERPREYVGRIHASASHLLQLINGVLDLSKIEAGHLEFHPERLSISGLVEEVTGILSPLAERKQIRVASEVEPGTDEVTIDAGRLRQVLYNYLSNALKFTGEGGRVTVRVISDGPTAFRLEVSDTGIGIAAEDLARLFVEFQQLDASTAKRYQGTGLGLAVSKRIVEAQGGRVGAVSEPGKGSTFYAVLPCSPSAGSAAGEPRILVIDDQYLDRMLLTETLQSFGCSVETAATGEEAFQKCQAGRFDAITLDLVLPDGPGWEALTRIRALEGYRGTPTIVISTCEPRDVNAPVEVRTFLSKPVSAEQLLNAMKRAGVPMRVMR